MTDVTVVINNPPTMNGYVDYYSVTPIRSLQLVLRRPISVTGTANSITSQTTNGVVVRVTTIRRAIAFAAGFSVSVQSNIASAPQGPSLVITNRPAGSDLNLAQITPSRLEQSQEERHTAIASYLTAGNDMDNMSKSNKQLFAKTVTANVKSTKDVNLVLSTLANNYGTKRTNPPISTSVPKSR